MSGTQYPAPSEVPEGIQHQYDQHAQVIYTRGDGTTAIETWSKGEKVESAAEEEAARWASRPAGALLHVSPQQRDPRPRDQQHPRPGAGAPPPGQGGPPRPRLGSGDR